MLIPCHARLQPHFLLEFPEALLHQLAMAQRLLRLATGIVNCPNYKVLHIDSLNAVDCPQRPLKDVYAKRPPAMQSRRFNCPGAASVVLLTELLRSGGATGDCMQRSRYCNCSFGRPVKKRLRGPCDRLRLHQNAGTVCRRDARIGCTKARSFITKWRQQSNHRSREPDSLSSYISKNVASFPEMVHTLH